MITLAAIFGFVAENAEVIGIGGLNLAFWLRLEHRLTKLETIVAERKK